MSLAHCLLTVVTPAESVKILFSVGIRDSLCEEHLPLRFMVGMLAAIRATFNLATGMIAEKTLRYSPPTRGSIEAVATVTFTGGMNTPRVEWTGLNFGASGFKADLSWLSHRLPV